MPYRPPLVAHETFVADPPELPVRQPGEAGLSAVRSGDVVASDSGVGTVALKAVTGAGEHLLVQLSAAGEGVIRVRLAADLQARTRSAEAIQLVNAGGYDRAELTVDGNAVVLHAGPIRAEVTLNPWRMRFLDATGRVLTEQNPGEEDISGRLRTLPFGRSLVDSEPVAYHESFTARADEAFVGFGEKFTPLDKRGQRPLMWNFDAFGSESDRAYKNVPLYLSSRGYGLLVDSGMPVEFDVCQSTHACVQIVVPDDVLDYYVIAGPTPTEVLDRYNALTSRPSLPPKWAFGSWISSGFFVDTQDRVMARARKIRERGIPCDVLHLDTFWQTDGHWSDMQWDRRNFPDPEGMLAALAEEGFRVCLWMNSYISHHSPMFAEAAERGYFLRRADGSVYVADTWHGSFPPCGIVDFTNPRATEWFKDLLRTPLRQGVALFKTDFAEGVPADSVAANGMSGTELHNVYSLLFNDAVAEVTEEVNGHNMVWGRSTYLGGQRHSAQWSGDTQATYAGMGSNLRGGLSHGLSGMPFWSHDAGGFNGTPTDDLFARWAQFGALSPLVRFHGTTSREPWEFAEFAEAAVVAALRLRYHLMPYIYSAAVASARTGAPMLRAMCVDYPDDPVAWHTDQQYLFGADLLVAPMIHPEGERLVYLPAGRWIDYWTKRVHAGGRTITVRTPIDQVPLFVRHGAVLPVTEPGQAIDDGPFASIDLHVWGGDAGGTTIADVNGDTAVDFRRDDATLRVTVTGPATIGRVSAIPLDGETPPSAIELGGLL